MTKRIVMLAMCGALCLGRAYSKPSHGRESVDTVASKRTPRLLPSRQESSARQDELAQRGGINGEATLYTTVQTVYTDGTTVAKQNQNDLRGLLDIKSILYVWMDHTKNNIKLADYYHSMYPEEEQSLA